MEFLYPIMNDTKRTHNEEWPKMAQLAKMSIERDGLEGLVSGQTSGECMHRVSPFQVPSRPLWSVSTHTTDALQTLPSIPDTPFLSSETIHSTPSSW